MRIFALLLKSLLLFGLIPSTMVAGAGSLEMPQAMDLNKQGQVAKRRHTPVMLVITSDSCPYCQKLEEEVLRPMLIGGEYDDRLQLQVLNQDLHDYRVDFDGKKRSPAVIAARYEVQLVPTVLLLGPDGEELAERLIGINVVDFYWAYLEMAIEEASRKLRESGS